MPRVRHTLNGKLIGIYYTTAVGHQIYLGHRQMRHLNRHYNGWSIDVTTLQSAAILAFFGPASSPDAMVKNIYG